MFFTWFFFFFFVIVPLFLVMDVVMLFLKNKQTKRSILITEYECIPKQAFHWTNCTGIKFWHKWVHRLNPFQKQKVLEVLLSWKTPEKVICKTTCNVTKGYTITIYHLIYQSFRRDVNINIQIKKSTKNTEQGRISKKHSRKKLKSKNPNDEECQTYKTSW